MKDSFHLNSTNRSSYERYRIPTLPYIGMKCVALAGAVPVGGGGSHRDVSGGVGREYRLIDQLPRLIAEEELAECALLAYQVHDGTATASLLRRSGDLR